MSEEHDQVLAEELEVLESIYVDELEKISKDELRIRVEPEEQPSGEGGSPIVLSLHVTYTPTYPDDLPELEIDEVEGGLGEEGKEEMMRQLKEVGEESKGMAMVFTLASHLREALTAFVSEQAERRRKAEEEKAAAEVEAEQKKFQGTPVTPESFAKWKKKFDEEIKAAAVKAEEEQLNKMNAKEREETKKAAAKLTGRELFERNLVREEEGDGEEESDAEGESRRDEGDREGKGDHEEQATPGDFKEHAEEASESVEAA